MQCLLNYAYVQWHRDELSDRVKAFVDSENVEYPVVIVEDRDSSLSVGLNSHELKLCCGSIEKMLEKLKEKQIILIPEEDTANSKLDS